MGLQQSAAVLLAGIAIVVLVASVSSSGTEPVNLPRHAESRVTSLTALGSALDPVWMYKTVDRDFRICPDGSGQIAEQASPPRFPNPSEERQWLASGLGNQDGVNQAFARGELTYITANDVRAGISQVDSRVLSPADALRRLASLLAETAPTTEVSALALAKAIAIAGIRTESSDGRVILTGRAGNGGLEVTLVFATSPASLLLESWRTQRTRPTLDLAPPFMVFEREILTSETETGACRVEPATSSTTITYLRRIH